jgi:hypothetical protein
MHHRCLQIPFLIQLNNPDDKDDFGEERLLFIFVSEF